MSDLIQIKRGPGAPASLQPGELGWDLTNKKLYCGDSNNTPVEVGGNAITLPLSVAEGGTGATAAVAARTNLGAVSASDSATTILPTINNVSGDCSYTIEAYQWGRVVHMHLTLTFTHNVSKTGSTQNVFVGYLTNYMPISEINATSYSYDGIFILRLETTGTNRGKISVRYAKESSFGAISTGDNLNISFTYILENS